MQIRIGSNSTCSLVQFEGEINWKTSANVRAALAELFENGRAKRVIVDLQGAEYIDGIGAATLVEGFESAQAHGKDFILTGLH